MNLRFLLRFASAALGILVALPAIAGEGHDHGETPATAAGSALPRFSAVSELFELVGVVNGRQLTLYLDHAASNAPVTDAKLDVELGGLKLDLKPRAAGEFEATLAAALKPGVTPVTATVTTPTESDLLAGEIDLHGLPLDAAQADAAHAAHEHGWKEYAGWALGGIVVAGVLLGVYFGLARRMLVRRANGLSSGTNGSAA